MSQELVVKFTKSRKTDGHIEYLVAVRQGTQLWGVWKRYSEFVTLHKTLKKNFPVEMKDSKLPAKKVIGNMKEKFIEQRKQDLEKYLNHLLQDNDLAESEDINAFLKPRDPDSLVSQDELEKIYRILLEETQNYFVNHKERLSAFILLKEIFPKKKFQISQMILSTDPSFEMRVQAVKILFTHFHFLNQIKNQSKFKQKQLKKIVIPKSQTIHCLFQSLKLDPTATVRREIVLGLDKIIEEMEQNDQFLSSILIESIPILVIKIRDKDLRTRILSLEILSKLQKISKINSSGFTIQIYQSIFLFCLHEEQENQEIRSIGESIFMELMNQTISNENQNGKSK
ncbi:sorting nexin [Anaeramoeba ignava]|uniref:Sorting nexin n=1 Tax=Anaeramoeba ignava TaxID=1746090 RepID=A0A9Q0R6H8_ANAIG|nr:sorting nexin [Anaeramoeba ignava]